jgi:hypothetical protein
MKVRLKKSITAHLLHVAGKKKTATALVNGLLFETIKQNLLKSCTEASVAAYMEHLTEFKQANQALLVNKHTKKKTQTPTVPCSVD